jgi:hypothetical protein
MFDINFLPAIYKMPDAILALNNGRIRKPLFWFIFQGVKITPVCWKFTAKG